MSGKKNTTRKNTRKNVRVDTRPSFARKLIMTVILLTVLGVAVAAICMILLNPERITKKTIEEMASEYYETFLYPSVEGTSGISGVEKYQTRGFTGIALRQLLFYDDQKNAEKAGDVLKYCDENETKLRFYPDAPFGKTDYHVEYTYDCEF